MESYKVLSGSKIYLRLIKTDDGADDYMQSIAMLEGINPNSGNGSAENGFTGSILQHSAAQSNLFGP